MTARAGASALRASLIALAVFGPAKARAADPPAPPAAGIGPSADSATPPVAGIGPSADSATPPVAGIGLSAGTPAPPAATPAIPTTAAAVTEPPAETVSDSFASADSAESEGQHRLELYGFADVTYTRLLIPKSSVWNRFYVPTKSFTVGNFNLYMGSNLGDSWRALAEVRFLYLPNGADSVDPSTGNVQRTNTTVLDYAGFEEPIHWGGILIERVWVEHEFSTLFKLQIGQFLTPYGIWNVDHGSPTIIGIGAPVVIADELFPARQTGLQLYGNAFFDPVEIGYHVTLSNGRGPVEYQDFNDDKAVGARLYLKTDVFGSLTVGTSAYRGGYYDRSAKYVVTSTDGKTVVDQQFTTTSKYEEFSLGADLKWQWKHLLVQGEAIMNEAKYSQGGRPRVQTVTSPQGFQPDYLRWGGYALVGYRTPWVQTMPYATLQYVSADPDHASVPPIFAEQFGLNIQPTPAVVLKTEVGFLHFSNAGSTGLGLSPLRTFSSQVSWAF
jgi:hypothetical protein